MSYSSDSSLSSDSSDSEIEQPIKQKPVKQIGSKEPYMAKPKPVAAQVVQEVPVKTKRTYVKKAKSEEEAVKAKEIRAAVLVKAREARKMKSEVKQEAIKIKKEEKKKTRKQPIVNNYYYTTPEPAKPQPQPQPVKPKPARVKPDPAIADIFFV